MFKIDIKKFLFNFLIILLIFFIDRVSKVYILKLSEVSNGVDKYLTSYLNLYLIWNEGVAFGLFSTDSSFAYNLISIIIIVIVIILIMMIIKNEGFKRLSLLFVLGGAIGNLFDRIYYSAVPDFIDFHIKDFHWFVFNVADVFITLGVILLIFIEYNQNKKKYNEEK